MPRLLLDEQHIHPSIQKTVAELHKDIVEEVRTAITEHDVVVVGMKQNPVPKKARKQLDAHQIPHTYLEYGSYFSQWRRRNALKMWTGWPTFPMVFVKGTLIGGASDLNKLVQSGELQTMLHSTEQ